MTHQTFKFFIFVLSFVFFVGCAESTHQTPSSYAQANEHIEKGNFESAILLMRDLLRKNPKDQKARVILASAHAAKAGLYVTSYLDLAQDLINSAKKEEQNYRERGRAVFDRLRESSHSQTEKDFIDTLDEFNRALWVVSDVILKFEKIPNIQTKEQYTEVVAAVRVLEKADDLYDGPLVYRGVLKLVLFRYHLKNYYKFPEIKNCQVNLKELSKKITHFHMEVRGILNDFSKGSALSSQSEKLQALTEQLDQSFSQAENKLKKYSETEQGDLSLILIPFGVSCP